MFLVKSDSYRFNCVTPKTLKPVIILRIQSIVTENDLITWYEKALRGQYHSLTAIHVLETLSHEIQVEFPVTENLEFQKFFVERGYHNLDISAYCD